MKHFVELYTALDETNKTIGKVDAMVRYFDQSPPEDAVWGLFFMTGRRPKRPVNTTKLWQWANEMSGLPDWLFAESYDAVGDLAELIATVLPDSPEAGVGLELPLHKWLEERLLPMQGMEETQQREIVERSWRELNRRGRFVWNKLITGAFRVGVSQDLVIRALSQCSGIPAPVIAHRLMGTWEPTGEFFQSLIGEDDGASDISKPYPFCLAHPHDGDPSVLGNIEDWSAEWKWDGIRSQLVRREGETFVWSRGEELISERFPEIAEIGDFLSDGTVIDGEIMAWRDESPLLFGDLQKRIGRKIVGKKLLADVPVALVAYDLLEWQGEDIRKMPFIERRRLLEQVVGEATSEERKMTLAATRFAEPGSEAVAQIRMSPLVEATTWEELTEKRQDSRSMNVEGLMLKRKDSPYLVGRKKGFWWKWKIQPYTVDAVLIYAARGSGKRASLYTDYTFGVWKEGELVPFAKAYSGLTDEEIRRVDAFIRRSTLEKFGPVRTVKPELVFELAFEGIQLSNRHKSGIAVRFPRIARWRHDKKPEEADTIDSVKELLKG